MQKLNIRINGGLHEDIKAGNSFTCHPHPLAAHQFQYQSKKRIANKS